jgi:DNA-binding transcriptional MerR regulator
MNEFPWEEETGTADAGTADAGTAETGTAETDTAETDTAETGTAKSVTAETATTETGTAETDTADHTADHTAERTADHAAGADSAGAGRVRREGGRPLVRKEYYAISEVSDLVGLPAHVLRYWETQFSVLNPSKNRSGNRVYQRKEIRLILLVKQLLYDEKYTVEGAKQRLDQLRRGGGLADATARALDQEMVDVLRSELVSIRDLLAPDAE